MDSSFTRSLVPRLTVLLLTATCFAYASETGHYRAAVVDYHVLTNNSSTPRENFMVNVRNYEHFIKLAHQQSADIIIFPEGALLGRDYTIFVTIPDPAQKVMPYAESTYDESIQTLSLYAKNYSIYLAVNLHERFTDPSTKKTFKYNTNIVFDRKGDVVVRYRKFNLYGEPLDAPLIPEHSVFESDFGVRFGQFICFDILFKEPALTLMNEYNVTDFIYPSQWFSELPFLTSVQRQWSWAVGNNVNLLSAGMNDVTRGNAGSGIFRGGNPPGNLYSLSENVGSTLLVGDVPIRGKKGELNGKPDFVSTNYSGTSKFPLLQSPEMSQFANEDVTLPSDRTRAEIKKKLCHNELCCDFDLSVEYANPTSPHGYKMVVYDGVVRYGIDSGENTIQVCGVVLCANESVSSCGSPGVNGRLPSRDTQISNVTFTSINITGNFIEADSSILPNILLWPNAAGEFLIDPKYITFDSQPSMLSMKSNRQIITVGIYSRLFSRGEGDSAYSFRAVAITMLLPLLAVVV